MSWALGAAVIAAAGSADARTDARADAEPLPVIASTAPGGLLRTAWTSYLRAGPGPGFAVLDELEASTPVRLEGCTGQWCRVRTGAPRAGYLARADLTLPPDPATVVPRGADTHCLPAGLAGYRGRPDAVRICGR